MITEEEYLKAQAVVDQYHAERQQQAEWDLEDDDPMMMDDEDDLEEQRENDRFERAMYCTCGAWFIDKVTKRVCHAADCVCGAD